MSRKKNSKYLNSDEIFYLGDNPNVMVKDQDVSVRKLVSFKWSFMKEQYRKLSIIKWERNPCGDGILFLRKFEVFVGRSNYSSITSEK